MVGSGAHQGTPTSKGQQARAWSTAITATTDDQVIVRGVPLDEAIGRDTFPAMLLRLWRGDAGTPEEADLLGACLVASIDHGPLSPSALVTRTVASTRSLPMSALAAGILSFSDFHGAVVTRAMRILTTAPSEGDLKEWAAGVFETGPGYRASMASHRLAGRASHGGRRSAQRRRERAGDSGSRRPGRRILRQGRAGEHRRGPGRRSHRAQPRSGIRRLRVRHRQEFRSRCPLRRRGGARVPHANDRSDVGPVRRSPTSSPVGCSGWSIPATPDPSTVAIRRVYRTATPYCDTLGASRLEGPAWTAILRPPPP